MKKNLTKAEKEARSDRVWEKLWRITFNYLYPFSAGMLLTESLIRSREVGFNFSIIAHLALAAFITIAMIVYQIKKGDDEENWVEDNKENK